MTLKVFNTLIRRKQTFEPMHGKQVKMFVCGQTTYDDAHVGHAKTYVQFDIIVRWLKHLGYDVYYVQNITDVDDKLIKRAQEKGVEPLSLSKHYSGRFLKDMEALKVKRNVDLFPATSDYIPQMIDQIGILVEKGYAYDVMGNVYYDVTKFKDYTKLSRMSIDELKKHRIEPDPRKRNSFDFALWKREEPGELAWDSPWGKGRPGWHIEDTAMTVTIFGPQYDLHGGASELIFPHHTNEIAQAEAATGKKPFVKYWLHTGVLNIKGEKMSKSLKNFVTIKDVLSRYQPEVLRLYYASTHYRKPIEFDEEDLERPKAELAYLYNTFRNIKHVASSRGESSKEVETLLAETEKKFAEAMNNDFNTHLSFTHLYGLAQEINKIVSKQKTNLEQAERIMQTFRELGGIFGILEEEVAIEEKLPKEVEKLIQRREEARKGKNWKTADRLREEIKRLGYLLEDTSEGVRWRKMKGEAKRSETP
ncbi:MAG: cysteine--tRNA ligase [Candidatus Bathyarchaeota archaeon]|nr:MAG: cysteine--tRNA ligase [Candidatus Bathyarchaeota archaeon]